MDVIFKLMILYGVLSLGVGVYSSWKGYSVIASVRPAVLSPWAGVGEIIIGLVFVCVGIMATRWWAKSR